MFMITDIRVRRTERTLRACGPRGPSHESLGGVVTLGHQPSERAALVWSSAGCMGRMGEGGPQVPVSQWHWYVQLAIVKLADRVCLPRMPGASLRQVVKHPQGVLMFLYLLQSLQLPRVITAPLPTQDLVCHPGLLSVFPNGLFLLSLSQLTFSLSC